MNDLSPGLGHNEPPPDLLVGDALRNKLKDDSEALLDRADQLLDAGGRVPTIEDEDTARQAGDFIKQIMAAAKALEGARIAAKEPYLEGSRVVDGFFKSAIEPLAKLKRKVEDSLTLFLRKKADEERRQREERERQAREVEAQKQREADEAFAKMLTEQNLADAVEAEKQAKQAEADRVHATKEADARAAELSRTRGEYGSVSSLRTTWTFSDLDRETLDLEALRPHLPASGLEGAVRAYIKAGGRELTGVHIFETTGAVVR